LMECAAADGREPMFEQYRRELTDAVLPVTLACQYHYFVGQGYRLFGRTSQARAALERALQLAESNRLNEMLFRVEQSLESLKDGGVVIIAEAFEPTPEVSHVAEAIHEMRELVAVGA